MKIPIAILLATATAGHIVLASETRISSFNVKEEILWGSLSAKEPTAGFYGQRFAFDENAVVNAISVFVYDHPDHEESGSSIRFGVWAFDGVPGDELFLSQPLYIANEEVGQWKTFEIAEGLSLRSGEYLIGVGQQSYSGFVAFGNARARTSATQGVWITSARPGESDNSSTWHPATFAPASAECPTAKDCALMVTLSLSDVP